MGAAIVALQSCAGQGGPTGGSSPGSVNSAFLALLPMAQVSATYIGSAKCITCHAAEETEFKTTPHFANNVGCENCHGPGSVHAASPGTQAIQQAPATANILTWPNENSPVVCAQCHGPIYNDWNNSIHAQTVTDPVSTGSNPGRCIGCHSSLVRTQILEAGLDPSNLSQVSAAEMTNLVNYSTPPAPSAATASCVTCHDPMNSKGAAYVDWQGQDDMLRHLVTNTSSTALAAIGVGTTPAQYQAVDQSCGECHNARGGNPADTALQTGTSRPPFHEGPEYNMLMGLQGVVTFTNADGTYSVQPVVSNTTHASAPGQCSHCHMGNYSHTFTVSYDTGCAPCHTATDAASRATSVKNDVTNSLYALESEMTAWSTAWSLQNSINTSAYPNGDPNLWDYTSNLGGYTPADSISSANEALVPIEVKRARYNYYYIINDRSMGVHNEPFIETLLTVANNNMAYALSKVGLTPAAVSGSSLTTLQKLSVIQADHTREQLMIRLSPSP